jgi:hypothetical protein
MTARSLWLNNCHSGLRSVDRTLEPVVQEVGSRVVFDLLLTLIESGTLHKQA